MAASPRPGSVRALGARRLKQATVGMVVAGVGGVAIVAVHDAAASASTSTTTPTTSTYNDHDTDDAMADDDTVSPPSTSIQPTVTNPQSGPQATSGGS